MNLALSNEFSKEYIAPVKSLSSHFPSDQIRS